MKAASLILAFSLSFATPFAAYAHGEHGKPQYGGIFAEAGAFQMELVVTEKKFTLYTTEHGEPLGTAGGKARLTVMSGQGKTDLEMKPAGGNRFEIVVKGKPPAGSKAVAVVTLEGKAPATARFALP